MKIFPNYSTPDFENEKYRRSTNLWSNSVYLIFCFSIVNFLFLSAFLHIDINVSSPGFVRPAAEISPVRSLVSGRIKGLFLHENKPVLKGDVLLSIESESFEVKEAYLSERGEEVKRFIEDLEVLTASEIEMGKLQTTLYRQAGITYQQQLMEAVSRYEKVKAEYNRNEILHREQVIADAEFEDFRFKLDQAELARTLVCQTQVGEWQSQLSNLRTELLRIQSDAEQLASEKNNHVILSPVTGTVQNLTGIYRGSFVYQNQELALISPDTSLIVEVFVSPNDIGLLQFKMPVRFQIDAFNYSQWGLAYGNILAISNDVHVIDGKPLFKIKCSLERDYLELKNGYRGYLKKGMSMRARFVVTQRTLWQLLYDKMEDWLDPNAVG